MRPVYKLITKAKYIHRVSEMAGEVWREVYARWYPPRELAAVIDALQSPEAIEQDMDDGANYFLVQLGKEEVGYFAWRAGPAGVELMHLYLLPKARDRAIGQDVILYCERLARAEGKGRLYCAVHEKALPVQGILKKLRYHAVQPVPRSAAGVAMPLVEYEHILGAGG